MQKIKGTYVKTRESNHEKEDLKNKKELQRQPKII